ncbi:hypothetical protein ACFQ7W_35595 [Streptomyces niveus]|uniref:hypothetical protein n=1 Tax=Streptomyces niveus TaxID=193462 RepID=UPI00368FAF3D
MTVPSVIAACTRCREIADTWWRYGIVDDKTALRVEEFVFYEHLQDDHSGITLMSVTGCRSCEEAETMSQFAMPDLAMHRADGSHVDPARLHLVHHLLEQTAEIAATGRGAGTLISGQTFTAYLYHRSPDTEQHPRCSPDRGHAYHVTVELTAPVALLTEDQTIAFCTAVAELERDLQYRELERLVENDPDRAVNDAYGLARWVHATIVERLADGLGSYLSVRVDAPDAGPGGPWLFPPAVRGS